ncbi:hypothetical protein Btru_041395 [Bulinus truncatus]|nr:hypothetical protein Btru_041395 [Bulinus truncatus]
MNQAKERINFSIPSFLTVQDVNRMQPAPLMETLEVRVTNYCELKNNNEWAAHKKNLEEIMQKSDLEQVAVCLGELDSRFGQMTLMMCVISGFHDLGKLLIANGADVDKQNHDGVTALMYASMYGEELFVEDLLNCKANVNLKDVKHMTALMWAVYNNNENVVKMLLDNNADANNKTPSGLTALHIAVEKGFTDIVELLLDKNVSVSLKSIDGWTPLMKSVRLNNFAISELLINNKADIHERNNEDNTALHISCYYHSGDCLDLLLEHGADVNSTNCLHMTPLMYAAFNDNVSIIKKLIKKGASVHHRCNFKRTAIFYAAFRNSLNVLNYLISNKAESNILDIAECSPLVYACQRRFEEVAVKLLKYKKDVWYKENEYPVCLHFAVTANSELITSRLLRYLKDKNAFPVICSPVKTQRVPLLYSAALTGNTKLMELLLEAGAEVNYGHYFCKSALHFCALQGNIPGAKLLVEKYGADVNIRDEFGNTPLMAASLLRKKEMVDFLIVNNASRYATNSLGHFAMFLATSFGFLDIVESLYDKEFDLEFSDTSGWTPLMFAIQNGDVQVVQFLLSKGAQINATSTVCATPLMIASGNGKTESTSILINNKADLSAVDVNGQTPLIHAAMNGHRPIIEILLSSGADVHKEDIFKRTPLMYVAQKGDLDSVKLFILHKADCSHFDICKVTPLMICAEHGFVECVKTFLEMKVNVDDVDVGGNTALHFSSVRGHAEVVTILLQHGAQQNKLNVKSGVTPLMLASAMGHLAVVQRLINCPGVDVNLCDKTESKSALIFAVQSNRLSVVKVLVEAGADVNIAPKSGLTALHLGVIMGFKDIVDYLLSCPKINVNTELSDGNSPLLSSVLHSNHAMIKQLINAGSDVKKKNKLGEDALTIGLNNKCLMSIKIILENCQISKKRKNDLIQRARHTGQTEMANFIENIKIPTAEKDVHEEKADICQTVNVSSASSQQIQDLISQISSNSSVTCESSNQTLPSDVTKYLQLDTLTTDNTFRNKTGCGDVSSSGKIKYVTINNIINAENLNMMIGDKNTLNDRINSESTNSKSN